MSDEPIYQPIPFRNEDGSKIVHANVLILGERGDLPEFVAQPVVVITGPAGEVVHQQPFHVPFPKIEGSEFHDRLKQAFATFDELVEEPKKQVEAQIRQQMNRAVLSGMGAPDQRRSGGIIKP